MKNIDGKKCYKAITKDYNYLVSGKKEINITAWYCPEINVSEGPNRFNGLPGLILELSTLNFSYVAKKINLNIIL